MFGAKYSEEITRLHASCKLSVTVLLASNRPCRAAPKAAALRLTAGRCRAVRPLRNGALGRKGRKHKEK